MGRMDSRVEHHWVLIDEMAEAVGVKRHTINVKLSRQRKVAERDGVEWPETGIPKPDERQPVLMWDRRRDEVRRYMSSGE